MVNIGLEMENLVAKTNHAIRGLLFTFLISTITCLIIFCYQIVACIGLNVLLSKNRRIIHIFVYGFGILMYVTRLYTLMASGQRLAAAIKRSTRVLEGIFMNKKSTTTNTEPHFDKLFVLRKRLEVYQYLNPISPYATFGLSNKTFYGTMATVLTYIVVLVKLRGAESGNHIPGLMFRNDTISY